jgi:hypothetical protein
MTVSINFMPAVFILSDVDLILSPKAADYAFF